MFLYNQLKFNIDHGIPNNNFVFVIYNTEAYTQDYYLQL